MGRSNPPPMALPPALNIHFFRLSPPLSLKSAPTPQSLPLRSDQSQLQPQPQPQPFNFVSNLKASLQNILSFNSFAPSVPPVPPVSVTDPSPPTCCTVPLFRPYVAKVPWHGGPRALLSRLFPRYGHYCGPNWSSGKEAGSMLWDRRPIDWLDHCCYCHDIGYDTHDQAKLLKADLAFLECLERPRMATKGGAHMSIIYRAMCIAGLRSFLIPYRMHLVRLQSGPSLFDYFGNVFAKIPSMSKVTGENQKAGF
ncbi:phospholipase A2 family protein [Carex rostrata]